MTDFDYLLSCGPTGEVKEALSKVELAAAAARADKHPTPAQAEAGNYRHGHISWKGLDIAIETPKGAYRRGIGQDGKPWQTLMKDSYGRIKRTEGADGDQVDVFICEDDLESEIIFVVNQVNHEGFDEHKCVLAATNEARAREVYLRNYSRGWSGLGSVTAMTVGQFKWWLDQCDTTREIKDGFWAANRKKTASDDGVVCLSRYKCPHCGGTNAFNGDPESKTQFRGGGKCYDCGEGFSIVGMKLKSVGEGPEIYRRAKTAAEYRFGAGPEGSVQGVHLRSTLHHILDQMKVPGLAYNNARTGDVYAMVDADDQTRAKVMAALAAKLKANKRVNGVSVAPVEMEEALQPVDLDDKGLETLFASQGFKLPEHSPDLPAYRRQWVQKRYRLQEDPTSHHMVGNVPALAHKQLMGQEPVYHGQLEHPDRFGGKNWTGMSAPAQEKIAGHSLLRIVRVKWAAARRGPFTVGVDLDGTLAETMTPFDSKVIGKPRPRAKKWMQAFRDAGARVIIFTVRGNAELVEKWLKEHEVPYDYVNENPDQPPDSSGKIFCDVYLDDRGVDATDLDAGAAEVLERIADHAGDEEPGERRVLEFVSVRILLDPEDVLEEINDDAVSNPDGS